jgi:hypothetical protein
MSPDWLRVPTWRAPLMPSRIAKFTSANASPGLVV